MTNLGARPETQVQLWPRALGMDVCHDIDFLMLPAFFSFQNSRSTNRRCPRESFILYIAALQAFIAQPSLHHGVSTRYAFSTSTSRGVAAGRERAPRQIRTVPICESKTSSVGKHGRVEHITRCPDSTLRCCSVKERPFDNRWLR